MSKLKIALLQMASAGNDQAANLAKGEKFCRQAARQQADIALFPEMWNVGYQGFDEQQADALESWQGQAIDQHSPFIRHFQALALELQLAIGLTYLEKWNPAPRNTLSLIDRHGRLVLTYAKVHTCDFAPLEAACTPGEDFVVAELDTARGGVKIGAMICYDREFPESARLLMLQGAEIILTPNACRLDELRLGQFKTRAFENMVGVAMTNYAAPQFNGHSIAFDGRAYDEDEAPRDILLVAAGEQEGVFMAEFELDRLRAYRRREVWGNAYRKPQHYRLLSSLETEAVFWRKDARQ